MSKRILPTLVLFVLILGSQNHGWAQSALDGFKYIIIPKKYDFLEEENQYRVNSQTKYLFDKNGYTTLLKGGDYPEDLKANPCLGAEAKVLDESNSFTTKLRISVSNCLGQVVYTSEQGWSKEKSYSKTYVTALNSAFESIAEMDYEFNPEEAMVPAVVAAKAEEEKKAAVASEPVAQEVQPQVESEAATALTEPDNTSAAGMAAATTAAVPAATASKKTEKTSAITYGNENIAFFLIDQGDKMLAYVVRSKSDNYAQGEMIGTFEKSSLPNVYRVEWKDMDKDIEQTTGYFDEEGNLKIDVKRNGEVEVLTFVKE